MSDTLISDTECFSNLWCAGFRRITDGKQIVLRKTADRELDTDRLRRLVTRNEIVGYNYLGYDRAMIWAAIRGLSLEGLKELNDRIILGGVRWWELDKVLQQYLPDWDGFPRMDIIDLMEPQPNAFAGLKTLNGRLHGRKMQDLPYAPDHWLSPDEIEEVVAYMGNDLDATQLLYESLAEPLGLRVSIGADLKMDMRSKSDSQIGEAIVKKRVEQITGRRIKKVDPTPGTTFHYDVPDFIRFETPLLQDVLERIRQTKFHVKANFKVDMPAFLKDLQIPIGESIYTMGIGGLHSTEANRSVYADDDYALIDADVAGQYPRLILKLGLFPKTLGADFLTGYGQIQDERIEAKRAKNKSKDQSLKIALNGCYGKLGSPYSVLFAPHLMIAVTLTGQLTLLMLIERAERVGISVVSGNTDGVLFRCPRGREAELMEICHQWEADIAMELEFARYASIHNLSVNTYIAIKEDGTVKRKGTLMNTRKETMRDQLMHNPGADIVSDAVVAYLTDGTPVEETIRAASDIRDFVTVVNVKGGGTWQGNYLGKVVRYYWGIGGEPILYKDPHPTTGNFKKVSKSDGAIPCMELPDELPCDIDYDRYVYEAEEILAKFGVLQKVEPVTKSDMKLTLMLNLMGL